MTLVRSSSAPLQNLSGFDSAPDFAISVAGTTRFSACVLSKTIFCLPSDGIDPHREQVHGCASFAQMGLIPSEHRDIPESGLHMDFYLYRLELCWYEFAQHIFSYQLSELCWYDFASHIPVFRPLDDGAAERGRRGRSGGVPAPGGISCFNFSVGCVLCCSFILSYNFVVMCSPSTGGHAPHTESRKILEGRRCYTLRQRGVT